MNPRIILLIAAALVVAIGAAFLARSYLLDSQPDQVVEVKDTVRIVVAVGNLPMGHILEIENLAWQEWPLDNINANYMQENFPSGKTADQTTFKSLVGSVVRYGITGGEPLTTAQTVSPGERGFLAAVLAPGMRAITIPVARTTGLAGLVFPGDRVDLILTQRLQVETLGSDLSNFNSGNNTQNTEEHQASVTFMRNVRVLGVDTRTDDMSQNPKLGKSVTLEVTPKLAEKLAVNLRLGTVSLVLRSLTAPDGQEIMALSPDEEMPTTYPLSHTWDYEASHLIKPVLQYQDIKTITVTRGNVSQILVIGKTGDLQPADKDNGQ